MVFNRNLKAASISSILEANIAKEARLLTDEAQHYRMPAKAFVGHDTVAHAWGEYVSKKDRTTTTNQIVSFLGIFKPSMRGIYQHWGQQHLHRYLAEFDSCYNNRAATGCNDTDCTRKAIKAPLDAR